MVFYGDHTVTVAGHCYSGDETTALLVVDPATPDSARDKHIRVSKETWAEYALVQGAVYLMISEPVYGTIFDEYRINPNIFTTNQNVEIDLDSALQNTIQLPKVREYSVSVADEDIFIDDTTQMIWVKADTALLRFFAYSLLVNPHVQERYGQLFNNTYYGTPIHTSDDDPWNPDNHLFNRYPALYMTVVPIYSNLNSDLVGSICLKYGDWNSTLSVLAVPQKPEYRGKATKSFVTPDELESYYGTKPAPFVSDRTKGVTGSFPLIDLPNYAIYDSISDTIIVFSSYGDILEVNDQGNVNLVDKNAIDLDLFEVDQSDPASIIVNAGNYPNPFNPSTEISFTVNNACQVRIDIYDILGRKVHRLIDRRLEAGAHKFKWDASGQASGVYFYRLFANDKGQITKKMVLVK